MMHISDSHVPHSSVVGSCIRPDISHAISVVCPGNVHWWAVKWILRYLWSTTDVGSVFDRYLSVLVSFGILIQMMLVIWL